MKKLLFVALAAVGMTACVQNEELVVPQNTAAITFDSFVGNATKADPSYNEQANPLTAFDVWAFMDETDGTVLTDEDVQKNGGVWSYYNTQYWFPNHTYYFAALAPMESANVTETLATGEAAKLGLGTVAFTNVDGPEDLLYAKAKVTTPDAATLANQGMDPVHMQFQHLLSKVKFTFQNGFTTENVTVKVSEVAMTAPESATIDLAQATYNWESHAGEISLAFGETSVLAYTAKGEATDERLTIAAPATQSYNVSFKVEVYQSGKLAMTEQKSAVIENIALEMGKAYNFTAVIDPTTLGLHAIEFTASVEAWDTPVVEETVDVIKSEAGYLIQTQDGFLHFAKMVNEGNAEWKNAKVILNTDVDLAGVEWAPIGSESNFFEGIFDGNGHKVSNFKVTTLDGHAGLFGYARATIKNISVENVTLVAHHYAGGIVGQGYVKLDNCHAENINITLTTDNHDNGDKAGGIVGQLLEGANMHVKNSTAKNVTIKGYRDLGGIAGMAHENNTVLNCSVENVTLIQDLSDDYQSTTPTTLGAVVGRFGSNVTYEGCTGEATIYKYAANQDGFVSALALGGDILLAAGEYDFPASGVYAGEVKVSPEALVVRSGAGVVVNLPKSTYIPGTTLTLEGVTFKVPAGLTYNESAFAFIHHADVFNMKDCVVEGGRLRLNVYEANIDECQFNVTTSSGFDGYGLFYYGKSGSQVNVSKSTFTTCGKAIVLYNEGACELNLKVDTCTFTSSNPETDKAAISVHSEGGIHGTLDIVNSTATDFANHNGGLWRDVNNNTGKDNNKFTVEVNEDVVMVEGAALVNTWEEFTAALTNGATDIFLKSDIEYASNYQLQKSVNIYLGGKAMTLPMLNIHAKTTVANGTINGKVYARKNSEIVFDNVKFSGAVADNLSTEGHLAIQGGCKSLYAKDCLFSPTSVSGSQTKPLSFEGGASALKFEGCEFKSSPYKKQVYLNSLSAAGSLEFINCNFNNKTPNIMFAGTCPLTNIKMSGTTKLSSVTFEINRAKDAVTAEDLAYLRTLIANNSFSSVRVFYAGGSSEYIR